MSRRSWHQIIPLLLATIALAWAGAWLGREIGHTARASTGHSGLGLSGWQAATLLIGCLLTIPVAVCAHELGHLFGGWLVGFRAFLFVVGPLRAERNDSGWQWHLNTDIALAGGLAGTAPLDAVNLLSRTAVMVAGGPVTSLLLGVAGLMITALYNPLQFDRTTPFAEVLTGFVALTTGLGSLSIAVATLIPVRVGGFLSDGARLLRLRRADLAPRDTAIAAIIGMSMAGRRPRDWDPTLIAAALEPQDGSVTEVTAWMLAQSLAADRGDIIQARAWLERIVGRLDALPSSFRTGTHLYASMQLALWGDAAAAREQIALASGPTIGSAVARPLAEAALHIAEGRFDEGRAMLPRVRELASASIDRGSAAFMLDIVDELQRRADAAGPAAPSH